MSDSAQLTFEDSQSSIDEEPERPSPRHFDPDLYKKFYQTKDRGGFLSIRPWWDAGKLAVDIGALNPGGGLKSSTVVWVSAVDLAVYLRALANGRGSVLFPDEEFVRYGGTNSGGQVISRVLKIAYWNAQDKSETARFAWKTGHFEGKVGPTGAIMPDMTKPPLSSDMIQVTRLEMATISYLLDLALAGLAARHANWLDLINSKRRGS